MTMKASLGRFDRKRSNAISFRHLLNAALGFLISLTTSTAVLIDSRRSTFVGARSVALLRPEVVCNVHTDAYFDSHQYQQQQQQQQCLLYMGKGDGKKKRKKKSASSTTPSSQSAGAKKMEPMRVTNDINIPIKRQIRWAQMNKEYYKQQANPGFRQKKVVRTKYRRTWDEEEIEQKKEERRRRGRDLNWDVILSQTKAAPLLIVDGYNIIYQWPRLKKYMIKGDLQRARQLLIDDLENLRVLKGWRIEVVFDGTKKSIVGPLGHGVTGSKTRVTTMDRANTIEESKHGVRVVYTGRGIEADSYIGSRCGEAKEVTEGRLTGSFIVATNDAMIRVAGASAGALCMSADRFVDELKAMKKAVKHRVDTAVTKVNKQESRRGQEKSNNNMHGSYIHKSRLGTGSVLVVDKRAEKAKRKQQKEEEKEKKRLQELADNEIKVEVEEDENGIPWWAQVPNQTNTFP